MPALIVTLSFDIPGVSKVISYLFPKSSMSHSGRRVSRSEINSFPVLSKGHFGIDKTSSMSLLKDSKILSNAVGNNVFFLAICDFVIVTYFNLTYFNMGNTLHCTIFQANRD